MKKKKVRLSQEASPGQQAADYVVGQVSQSLFPEKQSSSSSVSLSALFAAAPAATTVLFQPAPEPPQRVPEQTPLEETAEVKGQPGQKPRKPPKEKTAAEQKLESREASLQNADEDERAPVAAARKRRAADGEQSAEHWVMKRQKLRAQKEEEALKRRRTVFVGNLPVSCTKKTLRSLFRETGSIESIRFRSLVREDPSMSRKVAAIKRKVHPKKQSINAYVVFQDEGGVAKALERNGVEIEQDFHVRVDRVMAAATHDHKRSVFVGNLSFEINEVAIRHHFEECGRVEAVRLIRDQNSGLGKGFGYVLFETADSVQLALELDGSKLDGRAVRVKRSVKKEKLKKADSREKGAKKGPQKGPTKGPRNAPLRGAAAAGGQRGCKPLKMFSGKSSSFKGEMADPNKKMKKKPQKKKPKPNKKKVHI